MKHFFYGCFAILSCVGLFFFVSCTSNRDIQEKETEVIKQRKNMNQSDIPALCSLVNFPVGAAINSWNLKESDIHHQLLRHFNVFVYENEMKQDATEPQEGQFNLKAEDELTEYAATRSVKLRGHTLVWHGQVPDWMFKGSGKNGLATKDELYARMKRHIQTVVGEGKGKFYCWDVVNECISDDGVLRHDKYYDIVGSDEYIANAFRWAHEADPDALLVLNDYNIEWPGKKQDAFYDEVKKLLSEGVPVGAVGLQCHISIDFPAVKDIQDAIDRFAALGLKVQITELDMSVYSSNTDKVMEKVTDKVLAKQAEKYRDIFAMCEKEYEAGNLDLVVLWGLSDDATWLNNFPKKGRTNWPLMFGKNLEPKPCYWILTDLAKAE